jgi:hypothetical protein
MQAKYQDFARNIPFGAKEMISHSEIPRFMSPFKLSMNGSTLLSIPNSELLARDVYNKDSERCHDT